MAQNDCLISGLPSSCMMIARCSLDGIQFLETMSINFSRQTSDPPSNTIRCLIFSFQQLRYQTWLYIYWTIKWPIHSTYIACSILIICKKLCDDHRVIIQPSCVHVKAPLFLKQLQQSIEQSPVTFLIYVARGLFIVLHILVYIVSAITAMFIVCYRGPFQYKDAILPDRISQYRDRTVSQQSHL